MSVGETRIGTKFPDFWAALMMPFDPKEIRHRPQGGKQLSYITPRTAMIRLDEIAGPEGWVFEIKPWGEGALIGTLTIILPDGSRVSKSDVGGRAGMPDNDNDAKSAASDCFKRCAAMMGIGRDLYGDGSPEFADENGQVIRHAAPSQAPARGNAQWGNGGKPPERQAERQPDQRQYGDRAPANGRALYAWCKKQEETHQFELIKGLNGWSKAQGLPSKMVEFDAEQTAMAYAEATAMIMDAQERGGVEAYEHSAN